MQAKKSLGQHFLMHAQTANRIVGAAGLSKNDTVLEIGPGTGLLTKELLEVAGRVIAVEADTDLIPTLQKTFETAIKDGQLTLIHSDIRAFDPSTIKGTYALVANIPYYITGEIIRTFLETEHKPSSMTLLVQKEVATRIARDTKESLLSLSVKAYGIPRFVFKVPKGAFVPAPKVDSAVLSISSIQSDAFATPIEEKAFFQTLHAGFAHKRKRLAKNLEAIASKERVHEAFQTLSLKEGTRAEEVSVAVWRELSRRLRP